MRFAAKQFYLLENFDLLTGTKDIEMNKIFSVLALLLWMPISHAQSVWLQLQSRHDTVEVVEVAIGDYRVPPAISAEHAAVERGWKVVAVDAQGNTLYSSTLDDSRYLRGEVFNEITGEIRSVREAPAVEGSEEVLLPYDSQVSRIRIYRIDLKTDEALKGNVPRKPLVELDRQAIERLSKRAPLRGVLGDIDSDKVVMLNPDGSTQRKPLVFAIVGDGYAQEDMGTFREDAQAAIDIIMGDTVFDAIKDKVGFLRYDHVSPVSGQPDTKNIETIMRHSNQLGHGIYDVSIKLSRFTYHQIGVGGLASTNKIYIFKPSANTPLAITSIPHEIGHALFGLADEYPSYDYGGYCSGNEPATPNITHQTDRARIKWGDLIGAQTAVPTDENAVEAGAIGLYTIHKDCLYNGVPQGVMGGGRYGVKSHDAGWGAINERQIRRVLHAYLGNDVPLIFAPSVVMKVKVGEKREPITSSFRDSRVPLIVEAGSTSVPNAGGTPFTYRWKIPAELSPQVNGRYAQILAPEAPHFMQYPVEVEVSDGKATNARAEMLKILPTVRVKGQITGASSAVGGTWVDLTADTSHEGGDNPEFQYNWSVPAGWTQPIGLTRSTLRVLAPTPTASTPFALSVRVTPVVNAPGTENDPYPQKISIPADAVTLDTTVVVRRRQPVDIDPYAKIQGPSSIKSAQAFRLDGSGSEIPYSSAKMTYRWSAVDFEPASSTEVAPEFKAPAKAGSYPVSLTVTNSENRSNTVTRTLQVESDEVTPGPDRLEGPQMLMSGEVVTFNAVVNNLQDVRGYSWSFSPGFVFQNVNAPNIVAKGPVVTQSTAGRVVVLVYRSGPNPTSLSKDVVIEPKPVDSPAPVATISGPATVEAGKTLTLSGVGSSGDNLRYAWTANEFSPASSAGVGPIFTAPATAGPRTITLTVTAADNRSASADHTVNVTARQASDCAPAWVASKAYATPNERVSYDGYNYEVAHWTQNNRPDLNFVLSGAAKPWRRLSPCTP